MSGPLPYPYQQRRPVLRMDPHMGGEIQQSFKSSHPCVQARHTLPAYRESLLRSARRSGVPLGPDANSPPEAALARQHVLCGLEVQDERQIYIVGANACV